MVMQFLKKVLRNYYKPGKFYKIPFGPNRGIYFEYDPSIILSMMLGMHEPNTFQATGQILSKGMTVVDLGANRGFFSLFFAKQVGKTGCVYAFEPMPDNFNILKRAIGKNSMQEIIIPIEAAVVDKNEPVELYQSENHLMSSTVVSWAGNSGGKIIVPGITLDTFFSQKEKGPDFIKMDIEGGGVYALKGMESVIRRFRPCLLLESHTPQEDLAIGEALSLINYTVFRVGDTTEVKNLQGDHTDPYGIYGTVVGIPVNSPILNNIKPKGFQKYRFGQRT